MSGVDCTGILILHPARSAELPFQLTLPAPAKACPTNWPWRGPFREGQKLPQKLQQKLPQMLDGKYGRTICHWNLYLCVHVLLPWRCSSFVKLIQSTKQYFSQIRNDATRKNIHGPDQSWENSPLLVSATHHKNLQRVIKNTKQIVLNKLLTKISQESKKQFFPSCSQRFCL